MARRPLPSTSPVSRPLPGPWRPRVRGAPSGALLAVLLTAAVAGSAGCASGGAPREGPAAGAGRPAADTAERAPDPEEEARGAPPSEARARPPRPGRTALPPIPRRRGPIDLRVEYPDSLRLVRPDSNFIFGTVGTGDARLWIGGQEVEVEANGAFLAWLPVPEAEGTETGGRRVARYRLVARREDPAGGAEGGEDRAGTADSVVLEHPVRRPGPGYRPPDSGAWIDSTSLELPRLRWARPAELLDFSLRGPAGGVAWLEVGGERFLLEAGPGSRRHRASVRASALEEAHCGPETDPCLRWAEATEVELAFAVALGGDTARIAREMRLRVLQPAALPVTEVREAPNPEHGRSGRVVGRPTPYGPYAWRFPEGTRAEVTGRRGNRLRLAVPGGPPAWIAVEDALMLPAGTRRPRATAGNLRVRPRTDRLRMEVPLESAVPVTVSRSDPAHLTVRLHGTRAGTQRVEYGPTDPLLQSVEWAQEPGPVMRITFGLSEPLWGYDLRWLRGADGGPDAGSRRRLVLEIRRPPDVDPERPLEGRTVAVDPGHPGAGAYGPTGYYEGDANLAIARRLVEMLRERGARPVLIRDDTLPMGLYERTSRAVDAGAELFVSIHNNALPDGIRPFGEEGTSTYYYHPHARELAESVQAGMLLEMGLRDLGIFWGNLAVTRLSWMPSVLAEGAFMMMPRHEAALKTPEFQRAYARGVLTGIRGFLARRAMHEDSGE